MKPLYLIFISACILISCGHKQPVAGKNDSVTVVTKVIDTLPPTIKSDTVALQTDTTHKISSYAADRFFSNPLEKDSFSIALYGKNVQNGTLVFEIYSHKKKRIYQQTSSVSDMILDYDSLTPGKQADTVKTLMKHFLDDENFHTPAIDENEKIDDDFGSYDKTDQANWLNIKADRKAIGFSYKYNYETTTSIAFSKKQQKAVTIFYIE